MFLFCTWEEKADCSQRRVLHFFFEEKLNKNSSQSPYHIPCWDLVCVCVFACCGCICMYPCIANMWSQPLKGSRGQEKVTSACSEHVSTNMYRCVCAYLLCKAGCCGRRRAGVLACPGSWGHRYPPRGSANGSESTAQPCGKGRHSPTPRCNKHTEKTQRFSV